MNALVATTKERPMLFSAPMVLALLAGRKTQTRRVVKMPASTRAVARIVPSTGADALWDAEGDDGKGLVWHSMACPYGATSNRLWVRETSIITPKRWTTDWALFAKENRREDYEGDMRAVQYLASAPDTEGAEMFGLKKSSSIYMPRWASRITLEVTGVRVERLQAIDGMDAINEGIERAEHNPRLGVTPGWRDYSNGKDTSGPVASYRSLWESINGKGSWSTNPWVWVIEFKRVAP